MIKMSFINKSKWKARPGLVDLAFASGYEIEVDNDVLEFYDHFLEEIQPLLIQDAYHSNHEKPNHLIFKKNQF